MGRLIYTMITSADGFTTSPDGTFEWAVPTPTIHRHAGENTAALAGEIYGPRMWETMKAWQDIRPGDGQDYGDLAAVMYEFGEIWRAIPHHVFSREQGKPLTRDALRELKESSDGDLGIAGPGLAAVALELGEVDEVARYVVPCTTGGGTPWWPHGIAARLELVHHEVLDAGWLFERHLVVG